MAFKSQALPVLVAAAAVCLAAMRGLAFVGAATTSGGDPEESASKPFVSAMAIAKFQTFYMGFHFILCYFFTGQAVKGYWKEGFLGDQAQNFIPCYFFTGQAVKGYWTEGLLGDQAQKVATYLTKTAGQNMLPLFLWSAITVASGTVSKEYMLVMTLHFSFCGLDILRMTTTCEAVGISKSLLYPYILPTVVVAYLSYAAWQTM